MAQAVEDHRASSNHEPRSIYGLIVSEADRQLDPMTVLRRSVQYGLANYPELDEAGQIERAHSHVAEKYGEGGYLKLRLASAQNAALSRRYAVCLQTAGNSTKSAAASWRNKLSFIIPLSLRDRSPPSGGEKSHRFENTVLTRRQKRVIISEHYG